MMNTQCNFCRHYFDVTDGIIMYEKYFICDHCFDVFSLLCEITFDKDTVSQEEIRELLIETEFNRIVETPPQSAPTQVITTAPKSKRFPYPTEIKTMLDQYIIGQDEAKRVISTAVYNHFLRINNTSPDVSVPKANIVLMGGTGTGKAQPLYSKIKTPTGWTTMGEIKIGDEVTTPNGDIAKVIQLFPQGEQEIYRITFKDGRYAECTLDHLWKFYYKHWHNGVEKVISLREFLPIWDNAQSKDKFKGNHNFYIPLISYNDIDGMVNDNLPIDPYLLGYLLGDGCFRQQLKVTTKDEDIISLFQEKLHTDYIITKIPNKKYDYKITMKEEIKIQNNTRPKKGEYINYYHKTLNDLGLWGLTSELKFIPTIYKNASTQQKIALIQGIMDSDGTADKTGSINFSTTSKQLAIDVQEIIWSLGGIAKISEYKKHFMYKNEKKQGKLCYRVGIRIPHPDKLFMLDRKKARVTDYQYNNSLRLQIVSIEKVGKENAQCIMIDHPEHLYITDNYIVTHNTYIVETIAKILGVPFVSIDSSGLTPTGWKGNNIDSILYSLYLASDGDKQLAEKGIVYLDEIDKLMAGRLVSSGGDINGKGVQQSMLKLVEGGKIAVEIPHTRQTIEIDTTNILFIGGGAFNELDKVVAKRLGKDNRGLGFGKELKREKLDVSFHDVTHDDVIEYGFIPELMGRFPVITALNPLSKKDLLRILVEPKNSLIKQYQKLMELSGTELTFSETVLRKIVNKAIKQGTGARSLKTIVENVMQDVMYLIPSMELPNYEVLESAYVDDESEDLD